ncbi:hypothetical protein [Chromobacterium alticapitis]|uniref:hypothetical protein n=1 Tax=Chromobacterium alticapitis TaxID=2073169 RepID=UPI0013049F1C|nr:hypothetical protein [Chromobacterium alticapitis]
MLEFKQAIVAMLHGFSNHGEWQELGTGGGALRFPMAKSGAAKAKPTPRAPLLPGELS